MRILFCYPNIDTRTKPEIHLGIGYMSALLKAHGHQTFLYWPQRLSQQKFQSAVSLSSPDVIAFSATSYQYDFCLQMAEWARNTSSARILFGGIHPTLDPEGAILQKNVDMVCRGEGENSILALLESLCSGKSFSSVPNLWFKTDTGRVERNAIGPLVEDLDSLPWPDRELFNIREVIKRNGWRFELLSGRGCPFDCTYCSNHVLRQIVKGKGRFVRKRSVANVMDEIRFLKGAYRMESILFHDDTFTLSKPWLLEFCGRFAKEFHILFHCLARVETIDEESAAALRAAGCHAVSLGVESGSEKIRREVLKRNISDVQIKEAFRILKAHGIKRFSFNMIGIPEETADDIEKTIQLNRVIDPDWMGVLVFTPYPGTELYALCEKRGYIISRRYPPNYLSEKSVMLALPTLPHREFARKYRKFQTMAYGRYIREHYPLLYPIFLIFSPLLKTPLHNIFSTLAYKWLFKR